MTAAPNLAEATTAAVAALLVDRVEIKASEIEPLLPTHVRLGRPSKKAIAGAVKAAGWRSFRVDDEVIYRAAQLQSDPLARRGEAGDNSAGAELRMLIERAERLEEVKKGVADDINDVFAEAKSRGYDTKSMRAIMAIRKKKPEEYEEEQAILELYLVSMGMA